MLSVQSKTSGRECPENFVYLSPIEILNQPQETKKVLAKKSKYTDWSKEELIKRIEALEKRKKYGLVWDEERTKEKFEADAEGKLPVLKEVKSKEIKTDPDKPTHILIEGDNFHALSVLNYTHEKAIDVIYIDPPYNTGARDWKYNNNYVDVADPYRHSKWLSFLKSRLHLSKRLLKPTGIICVTIDDYEMPRLWLLLEEIFGENNHLGTVAIRSNPKGRKTERKVSLIHEYAIFFGRSELAKIQKLVIDPEEKTHSYKKDETGNWYLPVNLRKQGVDSLAEKKNRKMSDRFYPIYYDPPTGRISTKEKFRIKVLPIDAKGQKRIWRRGIEVIDSMFDSGDLWYQETKYGGQIYFKFRGGLDGEPPQSIWLDSKFSASEYGTQILEKILKAREVFPYPKSPFATAQCIKVCTTEKDIVILDFFAGSGTTLQSVTQLNIEDEGQRQCVLVTNNENNICNNVCYPRVKEVLKGNLAFEEFETENVTGNLKFYKTSFVPSEPTDRNKELLTKEAVEMLCLRENTFDLVSENAAIRIYRNKDRYTGIIFDQLAIPKFKKTATKFDKPVIVYVFSLGDDDFAEEFADLKNVKVCSIPEAILRVYRRIFQ